MKNLKEKIFKLENYINEIEEDKNKNKKVFLSLIDIINELNEKVEELTVNQETIQENIQYMDDDLSGIQEELFEELSFEELDSIEDKYIEIVCNCCNKPIFIEESALEKNKNIPCPYCGKNII